MPYIHPSLQRKTPLAKGPGPKHTVPLRDAPLRPKSKDTKKAVAKHAEEFGPQAALCRTLPCHFCFPALYAEDLEALLYQSERRISDPHHSPTVGAGGKDKDTSPACPDHHKRLDSPGWSEKRLEAETGTDCRGVAALLHRHLNPEG
jgi:hypothetical protein